jgi:drug/metabolite transporter (DMT)-like permease
MPHLPPLRPGIKTLIAGFVFAILWASASTATKTALHFAQPFVISICRFFLASFIMLFIAHVVLKQQLPQKQDWKKLMIYGLLNIAIYLGFFVIGMQYISAGIASLFIAMSPVFISIMAAIWLRHPLKLPIIVSLVICSLGILVAAYPLLRTSYVTPFGLLIVLLSMISYSVASLYFTRNNWKGLHILTINGWQTFFGAVFTLPFFFYFYEEGKNIFNWRMIVSVIWLALPVSIGAMMLWLFLLKRDPVRASFWLFLCPIFGIIIAAILLGEPLSLYTFFGVALVLAGLYLVQKKSNATELK